jgi:hypothetical protein
MFSWNTHDEFEMPGHIRLMERLLAEAQTVCEIIGDPRQPARASSLENVCIKRISKTPSDCAVFWPMMLQGKLSRPFLSRALEPFSHITDEPLV